MWRFLRNGLLGAFATLAIIEGLLRLLPVSSATVLGYHLDPEILVYPPHHAWQMSTGWDLRNPQRLKSNAAGFAAEREFVPNPGALALIGDSYVEASMLPPSERPAVQLERALGGTRRVYGMGAPGSSLLDYAERMRFASRQWGVRDFVFLVEVGDFRQALCGSRNVHSACLDRQTLEPRRERWPDPSPLKQRLREWALAQYLLGQLKVDGARLMEVTFTRSTPETALARGPGRKHPALPPQVLDAIVGHFVQRIQPYRAGKTIVLMDGRRTGPPAVLEPLDFERLHAMQRLREAGITVVDAEALWGEHLAHSPLSVEVGPYDKHLNGMALGLLAEAAAKVVGGP